MTGHPGVAAGQLGGRAPAISARSLRFSYPGADRPAIHDVTFSVERGEIFGFLGPSGAGKSTTQNILMTALRFDVVLQARNGFYWASGFLVLIAGGLLVAVPEPARANAAAWVPALLTVNLQITTFFFVTGLMLLERDEGTLTALAVSPRSCWPRWLLIVG